MKRAIHSGRLSRDERLHCFSFSLPWVASQLRLLAAGANGGGNKGALQAFFQASPNKSLAIMHLTEQRYPDTASRVDPDKSEKAGAPESCDKTEAATLRF